jgi:hypothetical protein
MPLHLSRSSRPEGDELSDRVEALREAQRLVKKKQPVARYAGSMIDRFIPPAESRGLFPEARYAGKSAAVGGFRV